MIPDLSPTEVARKLETAPDRVVLLDVREPNERSFATIQPSIHIPMYEVPGRLDEIPKDRDVVVYCHGGSRSQMVAHFLQERGFSSVANLAGGIDAWSVLVDPDVPRYY